MILCLAKKHNLTNGASRRILKSNKRTSRRMTRSIKRIRPDSSRRRIETFKRNLNPFVTYTCDISVLVSRRNPLDLEVTGWIYIQTIYLKKCIFKLHTDLLNTMRNFQGSERDLRLNISHWFYHRTAETRFYIAQQRLLHNSRSERNISTSKVSNKS